MDKQAMLSRKRKDRDIARLIQAKYAVEKDKDIADGFVVEFHGPKDTFYESGIWKLRIYLPDQYPYKSPSIGFMNKIFHPNVDFPLVYQFWINMS